jgi:hypothetical protein
MQCQGSAEKVAGAVGKGRVVTPSPFTFFGQ